MFLSDIRSKNGGIGNDRNNPLPPVTDSAGRRNPYNGKYWGRRMSHGQWRTRIICDTHGNIQKKEVLNGKKQN